MNFFQRRKILKKANFLELTPVRVSQYSQQDDGKVDILMPRFRSKFWSDLYRNTKKGEFIRIHLDNIGSQMWLAIDGTRDVGVIARMMQEQFPDKISNTEEAETRVTRFCTLLYHQDYITFREIQDPQ